jgi:O-antigen/teichoic acid export membrane protein
VSEPFRARIGSRAALPSWIRTWAKDSAVLLGSQGLTIIATSIAAILIARHLSPSDWGVFSGFLGLSLALAVVVEFGLATWLLRELSRLFADPDEDTAATAARLVSAALAVNAGLTSMLVGTAIVVTEIRGVRPGLLIALVALLVYGGLYANCYVMEAHLRARRRIRRVATASMLEKYVLVALVVITSVASAGIVALALAYLVAGIIRVVYVGRAVFGLVRLGDALPRRVDVRTVVKGSFPFALSTGSLTVIPRLDTFALLVFSATSAGYFAVGDRLLGPAVIIPSVLGTALYPFMAPRAEKTSTALRLAALFGALGGVFSVAGVLAAPTLVPLVFGEKYHPAVSAVRVLLLSLPFVFASAPLLVHGYSRGREKAIVVATLGVSLLGTGALLTGQAAGGVTLAAGGYVLRQLLFVLVLACVGLFADRVLPEREPEPGTVSPSSFEGVR